jgi:hypothetical protein
LDEGLTNPHPKSRRDLKMSETMNLVGTIKGCKWDDFGVLEVSLLTDDEDEYLIDQNNGCGCDLLDHVNSDVELTGVLTDDDDQQERIIVKDYLIIS